MKRLAILCAAAAAAAACDSANVKWAFVSNPSGDPPRGGAIIVITGTSSSAPVMVPSRSLAFTGMRDGTPATVRLATTTEAALIAQDGDLELRSPSLPEGRLVLADTSLGVPGPGASLWEIEVADASEVHPAGVGQGRVVVAARGNVVLLEHLAGLVVYGDGPDPEVLPPGHVVDATGTHLQLHAVGSPARVLSGSAPPTTEERVVWNEARGSVRILGPSREALAEVPESAVTFAGGVGGVFLTGDFPGGLGGTQRPFTLVAATDNRYLLRIDG